MIIDNKEIRINRDNAFVSEVDIAYCNLLEEILSEGKIKKNRTGIDAISIPGGWSYKFDVGKSFPILESKYVLARMLAPEIQWIHQVQSNDVKWLQDRGNHTWDLWVVDDDGIYRVYEQGENAIYDPEKEVPLKEKVKDPITGDIVLIPMLDVFGKQIMVKSKDLMEGKDNPRTIKEAIWFGKEYAGTIGIAYGAINRITLAPQRVEYLLKHNPTDRRMIISLLQDEYLTKAVLPSCVWASEYMVLDNTLYSTVIQGSADVPLGLPFDLAQYALLLSMFAKTSGLEVGTMSWSIMDAHIYVNQLEGIKKQLRRYQYMQEYSKLIQNQNNTYVDLEALYRRLHSNYNQIHEFAKNNTDIDLDNLKVSKRINELKKVDFSLAKDYEAAYERKISFEHMVTRENPELELADHDSIFDYSTEYVDENNPYLKENPIGNKELVLKKYNPTPFISIPIAQ